MRVSEVKPGMKGYCLTVFSGTTIEKFDVEVISVMKNMEPGFDAVLINCTGGGNGPGRGLEHLGATEGMSGSPVFLYDDSGKPRMIGAFAFGFPLAKDAIAGVQPIEYMLSIADPKLPRTRSDGGGGEPATSDSAPASRAAWSYPDAAREVLDRASAASHPSNAAGMQPCGLSVGLSGVSSQSLAQLKPFLASTGLRLLDNAAPAGKLVDPPTSVAGGRAAAEPKLEPGSTLVVPLVTGDAEIAALGTCTEVIGDRVFGFGHLFQGEGGTQLPMAAGYVNTIIANLSASFKVGASSKTLGTLRSDTNVGVGGILGSPAPTVPVTIHVRYADGSQDRTYHYNIAKHNQFTPILSVITAITSVNGDRVLPPVNTMHVDQHVKLAATGKRGSPDAPLGELRYTSVIADANVMQLFFQSGMPLMAAANNPFGAVLPAEVETNILIEPGVSRQAELVDAITPRSAYTPGETVSILLTYRPWHQKEQTRVVSFDLPKDLQPGSYNLVVSDSDRFQSDDASARPDRYHADNVRDVVHVLQRVTSFRSDSLYLRLTCTDDPNSGGGGRGGPNGAGKSPKGGPSQSLAVGRKPLLRLPGSRRQIIENGAAPNVSSLTESRSKAIPWDFVTSGSVELPLTIEDEPGQLATGPGSHQPKPPSPNSFQHRNPTGRPARGNPGEGPGAGGGGGGGGGGPTLPGE
jgi:hypothetical protein